MHDLPASPDNSIAAQPRIGFVGTGIMGASMAGHLLAAGHELHVHSRTRDKALPLVERGGIWHDTPADVAAASDVVITMLGLPSDVEEVYFGGAGGRVAETSLLGRSRPGTLLIDMTTSSPALAARIAEAAAARGLAAIDAPVSGGDVGARNATLVIMVGGAEDAFARAQPILARLGSSVTRLGPAGSGQRWSPARSPTARAKPPARCLAGCCAAAQVAEKAATRRVQHAIHRSFA
jgi:3-hydroxyisobutyrate dehydrogenase